MRRLTFTLAAMTALAACAGTGGGGDRPPPSTAAEARLAFQAEAPAVMRACLTNLSGQPVDGTALAARGYAPMSIFGTTTHTLELRSQGLDLRPERISVTVGNPQNCIISAVGPFGAAILEDVRAALVANGYTRQASANPRTSIYSGPLGQLELGGVQQTSPVVGVNILIARQP